MFFKLFKSWKINIKLIIMIIFIFLCSSLSLNPNPNYPNHVDFNNTLEHKTYYQIPNIALDVRNWVKIDKQQ